MGSGASALQSEEKVLVSKAIQKKYEDFQSSHNQASAEDELQLFETLKS